MPMDVPSPARKFPQSPPAYRVIPIIKTDGIDPGETFIVDIYFSGYGHIERQKLSILFPHPEILDSEDVGEIRTNIAGNVDLSSNIVQAVATGGTLSDVEEVEEVHKLDETGISISVPTIFFVDNYQNEHGAPPDYYPQIFSELSFDRFPPIRLRLHTNPDAKPGNYSLPISFTFGSNGYTYQSKGDVALHINTPREQLEPWITRAGIATVIIALLSLVNQAGFLKWLLITFY